jgi:benzoate/toluate 1,2-dioxygenase beta subunit
MSVAPLPSRAEIEDFLFREAHLLDDRSRWDEWLELYTPDCLYWIPYRQSHSDPHAQPSIVIEDRLLMEVRIRKLRDERSWSQQPITRTARIVGNVMLNGFEGEELVVRSTFHLLSFRRDAWDSLGGHYTHRLVKADGAWKVRQKRVDLLSEDGIYENVIQVHL